MCQYHTWFRDDEMGFVIQCKSCRKIQVAFGMMMAHFHEADFHQFRSYIQAKRDLFCGIDNPNDKTILLHTPCESLNLLFSFRELCGLHEMLEEADTEMKTQSMLQLFQEQG